MHENHAAFIEWASRYDQGDVEGKTLPRHEAYLARQTCPVLRLSDPATTSDAVDAVLAMI